MPAPSQNPVPQACVVPVRTRRGAVEICLVTTRSGDRWVLPKGMVDAGETLEQTALKEAHEEAGLSGRLSPEPLGEYDYSKWGLRLRVTCFLMHVETAAASWLESAERDRRWTTTAEARRLLDRAEQRQLLDAAITRLQEQFAE